MKTVTTTMKIKFLDLNQVKADLFAQMTAECTELANELLKLELAARRQLTTAKVVTPLMSALANQVIRQSQSKAAKKTKQFKVLPPEVNNQNWKLCKQGEMYSVSFPTIQGVKRIPLQIQGKHWQPILDALLAEDSRFEKGSLKLIKHRKQWYAFISVTQEVPEVESKHRVGLTVDKTIWQLQPTSEGLDASFLVVKSSIVGGVIRNVASPFRKQASTERSKPPRNANRNGWKRSIILSAIAFLSLPIIWMRMWF